MQDHETPFFHYTAVAHLPAIVKSGYIKVADKSVSRDEKPAVWVSSNPSWEVTATKMIKGANGQPVKLTLDEQLLTIGCARIRVIPSDDYITWKKFKQTSGIKPDMWKAFTKTGEKNGANPKEWYACYRQIDQEDWMSVEAVIGEKWMVISDLSDLDNAELFFRNENRKYFNIE